MVPSNSSYDPEVHLSVGDVKVNDRKKLSFSEVYIKASKRVCVLERGDYIPRSYRGGYRSSSSNP